MHLVQYLWPIDIAIVRKPDIAMGTQSPVKSLRCYMRAYSGWNLIILLTQACRTRRAISRLIFKVRYHSIARNLMLLLVINSVINFLPTALQARFRDALFEDRMATLQNDKRRRNAILQQILYKFMLNKNEQNILYFWSLVFLLLSITLIHQ